jgi:alpha-ketoglutarate-dependent taurine dioxygenase
MGSIGGMGVGVSGHAQGGPRFVDIERRLSFGGDLLDQLATLELEKNDLLVRFNADFEPQSFVDAARYSSKFGLTDSSDGKVSNVLHRQNPLDRSARTDTFDFHNDGLYLDDPPYYCALYCIDPGDGDIPTVFVESSKVLDRLAAMGISLQALSSVQQAYIDRRGAHHVYDIIRAHPRTGYAVLQYFDGKGELLASDSKPRPSERSGELEEIKAAIHRCICECSWESQSWKKGHFVVWDNYAFLHARLCTKTDLRRHLARFWIRRWP